jgi:hypothetical protein
MSKSGAVMNRKKQTVYRGPSIVDRFKSLISQPPTPTPFRTLYG